MLLRNLRLHRGTSVLALFSVPVALVLLSDNILSFIIPINLEEVTGSNFLTGLIIAFSSLVGLFSDYLFPPFLKNISWKMQFLLSGIMALFLPIIATLGKIYSSAWLFLIASIIWGIYYELLIFSEEDFMVEEENKSDYSKDWSILSSMHFITNVIGPIIASAFILMPIWQYTFVLIGFVAVGLIYTLSIFGFEFTHIDEDNKLTGKAKRHKFNLELFREIKIWKPST